MFVEQFCGDPPYIANANYSISTADIANAKYDISTTNVTNSNYSVSTINITSANYSISTSDGSDIWFAQTTYIDYTCNDGYVHYNGSLHGTCLCDHSQDVNCTKPVWQFKKKLPTCPGMNSVLR